MEDLAGADWSRFAALVLAPGVPLTHPEPHWAVRKARAAGVEIIGDIELCCRERAKSAPEAPFVAVTGTNGKSTTTALIAHILKAAGRDVAMGGNIGTAVLALDPPAPDRCHVIEMSSFQIELTPTLRPTVGVLLNISPDHLDRHGSMENYARLKALWCRGASTRSSATTTTGAATSPSACASPTAAGSTSSRRARASRTAGTRRAAPSSPRALDGTGGPLRRPRRHRCAARAAQHPECPCRRCRRHDARREPGRGGGGLATFPGLAHRLEEIGRLGGTLFINDSKATNADSAGTALAAFARDVFWILGGRAKQGGIASLAPFFARVAKAYLIGEATEEFAGTLQGKVPFERCGTLDPAVAAAARDAAASGAPEPVVLLSPACASYDHYRNFEVRGDAFRALVAALPGIELRRRPA